MNNNALKFIITIFAMIVLFGVAISLLSFAIRTLLPIAIIVIAAYIVYNTFIKKKY